MLTIERHAPEEAGAGSPVAVLLHGRGSDERDLPGLKELLPAGTVLLTPRAPHPGAPWGYGPGWAWYRYVERDRLVPDTLESSLDALDELVEALPDVLAFEPGPLFMGGFSQGGTTSLAWALRHPGRLAGALCFSGFLPADGLVDPGGASGLRVFWGHGRRDPAIPFRLAVEGRERLASAGADVTARDYDIGHWIDRAEMEAAADWMREVAAGGPAAGG